MHHHDRHRRQLHTRPAFFFFSGVLSALPPCWLCCTLQWRSTGAQEPSRSPDPGTPSSSSSSPPRPRSSSWHSLPLPTSPRSSVSTQPSPPREEQRRLPRGRYRGGRRTSTCTGEAGSTAPGSTATPARALATRSPASAAPSRRPSSSKGVCVYFSSSRIFVMPSRMCINPIHNNKGILHKSDDATSEERWAANSCTMDSLYDLDLISKTVPVILDNSKMWYRILSTSMKLGKRGLANIEGITHVDLKDSDTYSNVFLINRTASPLSWFMECKDRNNRSSIALPYSFLPSMSARKLRDVADKIKAHLGDYDAIHVRRGDKIKTRKDRFGVARSLHPHLDRDTRPEFIQQRIEKWVSPGRTLFIASNERTPGFFSPLSARYKLAYSFNFSSIIDPVIENNYQLFMIERLILAGAKSFIRTFKQDESDLSLTDDPKKNTKNWQIPSYTYGI